MRTTVSLTRPQRSLSRRYAMVIAGVSVTLVLAAGLSEMYFGYRESREHMSRLQSAQAHGAAREVEQFLSGLEASLRDAAKLPWGQADFGMPLRRHEFQRLMVLYPVITELQWVDREGREQLFVSRRETDRLHSGLPVEFAHERLTASVSSSASAPRNGATYGVPYFRGSTDPMVRLAVPDHGPDQSMTVASLNLRFLADVTSRLSLGETGHVYVVDTANRLIAHPKATHVSRSLDMGEAPPVRKLRETELTPIADARRLDPSGAVDAVDLDGKPVIASAARVAPMGWLVVIEQPRSQALQPALSTLGRTIVLMLLGAGAALTVGLLFASRMAAPIVRLRMAAGRIASGDLGLRVAVQTGDEIELLANDFNEMADKLQASYTGLETKVEERTHELTAAKIKLETQAGELTRLNSQLATNLEALRERTDEAERANAAKTRFLAAASHDLRQPMHTIGLLTGVLRERLPGKDLIGLADKVLSSVAVMENLFGSLLDISKLDAGAVKTHVEEFRIQLLLDRLRESFEPQAVERRLRLRVHSCSLFVRSDITILERIFGNLISNALRYTHEGAVLVGCRPRGDQLSIQVIDTGIGISPRYLERIFDEFYRLDESQRSEGLGLGLSIVKRSAEMLQHELMVRSAEGLGSVFELLVPLARGQPDKLGPRRHREESGERLAGIFVLILDDNAENRDALRLLCEQWKALVLCAQSTEDALAQLRGHLRPPDLIISDYNLGQGLNGVSAIAEIRAFAEEEVPALLLTADANDECAVHAATLGAAATLSKPAGADRIYLAAVAVLRGAA